MEASRVGVGEGGLYAFILYVPVFQHAQPHFKKSPKGGMICKM